ncbi:serine/arginine-rich splicing factor SC35-like isoform X1 [Sesamum indicum]|uniref:Serine/arginine-rich splicing factor SC35-like isoform X1 n=1 Tax=Sesamum indicum TaxID=4182 RepID=A0A8M8V6U2_SESIN|nr:serine/arginine-rich splicing factor SC35-like isoform X1 [Sesamum indicum]
MPRPTDIADTTYSLLVLNVNFRTTADDLFPLFEKYGKVIDVFIPRDRRTGESRGFAFVRFMYKDEAQKAVDKLDGRVVDGREIAVQFAKYGPHAERIHDGRIVEKLPRRRGRSRSRSPRRRSQDGYYEDRDYRRRYRSRSMHRDEHKRDYWHRSRSYSGSPEYDRGRGRRRYDDERRGRSRSFDSASPNRNLSPRRASSPRIGSPGRHSHRRSITPGNLSPRNRVVDSQSPLHQN